MRNDGAFPADAMSLRDWFAGMALQGLAAQIENGLLAYDQNLSFKVSAIAFAYADAMLAEREKEKST